MRDWPSVRLTFPDATSSTLQDLAVASLDAADVAAIEETTPTSWLISFRTAPARDAASLVLREVVGGAGVILDALEVSDEDWARRSQAALGPVRVGRIVVSPPWCAPSGDSLADAVLVVIEPSMGFGSGHHATTRLCLEALQSLAVAGAHVVDIGTGSGVLAIAAAKLGAATVVGLDNDPDAIETASAGQQANGPLPALTFRLADFRDVQAGPADIVLANLTGGLLAASAATICRAVAPGGRLVLSGITSAEATRVREAFAAAADVLWQRELDGWLGLVLAPRHAGAAFGAGPSPATG